jgi:hypothetical protein
VSKNEPATLDAPAYEVMSREHPQAVPSLRELEEGVRKFQTTYSLGLTISDDDTVKAMGGTLEEAIQLRIAYIQTSLARRLTDLLVGLIGHINDARLLEAALNTRACMELAGALVYYERQLTSLLTTGISTPAQMAQFNEVVKKATKGGRFDWARWLLGGADIHVLVAEYADASAKPTSPVQIKNALDFVKALDDSVAAEEPPPGAIRAAYALLCDVCHPAVGGYMLYLAVPQPAGQLKFEAHSNPRMAAWFVGSIIAPTANRLMKHAARSLNRLTHIASTVKAVAR